MMIATMRENTSLKVENAELKSEVTRLNGELGERDKVIKSLELQIQALLAASTPAFEPKQTKSTKTVGRRIEDVISICGAESEPNNNATERGRPSTSHQVPTISLRPPRRSTVMMETPLAPEINEETTNESKEETIKEGEEEGEDKLNKHLEGETRDEPKEGEKKEDHSVTTDLEAKEEGKITEEKDQEKPLKTGTTQKDSAKQQEKKKLSTTEEDDGDDSSSRPVMKSGLKSNRTAIKALPREVSIANDDDDEVTKFSVESNGSPTIEVDKTPMRDAYGAKGLYTGTVSRKGEQFPHGRGTMEYESGGKIYEGDWYNGHWHGKATIKTSKGVYTGTVVNDLKDGDGEMFYTEGHTFKGKFEQDEPVVGVMTYVDKREYVGQLRNHVMHGKGRLTYPDGSKYTGEFQNGVQHGTGTYNFSDGSIYEGQSVMGVYEGKGQMTWSDGGWYEGEWKQGEANGHGMEIRPDGSLRHHGKWRKGVPVRN